MRPYAQDDAGRAASALVLREDAEEFAPCLIQHIDRLLHLLGVAGTADLRHCLSKIDASLRQRAGAGVFISAQ